MAVRQAISAARHEIGLSNFFDLPIPATPDVIQKACGVDSKHFVLHDSDAAPAPAHVPAPGADAKK